jgi:DNA-binding transcriptional LysR family regulator
LTAPISLNAVDLNLLRAFDALYEERHVTRAAARIGIGQPAMSSALARLRALFDDVLFVRGHEGMLPTARARELAAPIAEAMARLRAALEPAAVFDAATSTHTFVLAGSDYAEAIFLPHLLRRLGALAPQVSIRVTRNDFVFEAPVERLESGEADFAVGLFPDLLHRKHEHLFAEVLFGEHIVGVVRARHPRVGARVTMRGFAAEGHVRVIYRGDAAIGTIDTLMQARGYARRVGATVSHFLSVPPIIAATDLIGVLPERLARKAVRSDRLRVFALPFEMQELPFTLVWPANRQHDLAHAWLREQITLAAEAL